MWRVLSSILGEGVRGCQGSREVELQANSTHLEVQLPGRSNIRLRGSNGEELCYGDGVTGRAGRKRQENTWRMDM